jgi:dienelactone hydrolase
MSSCAILSLLPEEMFTNSTSIADQFAANGYFVVIPDLFHGDPVKMNPEPGFSLMEWLAGHPVDRVEPVVKEVLAAMKASYGVEKIGAVGHCFGAKVRGCLPPMLPPFFHFPIVLQ